MFPASDIRLAVALATVDELPPAERERVDAERRASRLAARRAVARVTRQAPPLDLRPRWQLPPVGHSTVSISLTHCEGRAAAVAAPAGVRVGIDLERLTDMPRSHARYFLTVRERRSSVALPLVALWTMKEAAWKAIGAGPDARFHELELQLDRTERMRAALFRGVRYQAAADVSTPWPGFIMTAVRLGDPQ